MSSTNKKEKERIETELAFWQGFDAARANKSKKDNPYYAKEPFSQKYKRWDEGYDRGY